VKHLKITSVLLSVAMCMSFVMTPVTSVADETEAPAETSESVPENTGTEPSVQNKETEEPSETTKDPKETEESKEAEPSQPAETEPEKEEKETEQTETPSSDASVDKKKAKNTIVQNGTCGENLTWTLDDKGTLIISGTGPMDDYRNQSKNPWGVDNPDIKKIIIQSGVTTISPGAFLGFRNVSSVSIPEGITSIGDSAFGNNESLTEVKLPDSLETIGFFAFASCKGLKSISIPSKVHEIQAAAFYTCPNLKSVKIDEDLLNSFEYSPFESGTNIEFITYSNVGDILYNKVNKSTDGTGTVMVIGATAYVKSVVIPATITLKGVSYKVVGIGANAFRGKTKITSVSIGANVVSIGNNAFFGCTGLTKVSGGARLKTIGANAFARCPKLTSFTISSKVLSKIGTYAFAKDSKLKTIKIKSTTKLTKKGVKKSLKSSKVKTVKVKKSKVKKYKKYFTKKNCGRKVKVKK